MDLATLHRLVRGAAQSNDAAKSLRANGGNAGRLTEGERGALRAMRMRAKSAGGSLANLLLAADPGEWVTPPPGATDRLKA